MMMMMIILLFIWVNRADQHESPEESIKAKDNSRKNELQQRLLRGETKENTLDGSRISFQPNDLTNKIIMSNTDKLIHRSPSHAICDDDRSRYLSIYIL